MVRAITEQYAQGREPSAWLFVGPTGTGKTSIARILAISLQCKHGVIGEPCDECRAKEKAYEIYEVNASEVSGVEEIRGLVQGSVYLPKNPTLRKVYVLDEAQRISVAAQNLLLKYTEDAPMTTVWIICTTDKSKILETLRRRCQTVSLKLLAADDVEKLVARGYAYVKKHATEERKMPKASRLVEQLWEYKVQSPGIILNAVESYLTGMTAEEAVKLWAVGYDTKAICRALEKGDWNAIKTETSKAENDDLKGIRAAVAGYLRATLEAKIPGPRAKELVTAIREIAQVDSFTDSTQAAATVAALYSISQMMGGNKTENNLEEDEKDNRF
jgi:replication-associated recombination protein RarA